MLLPLRSTVTRSLSLCPRSFSSLQTTAGTNESILNDFYTTFRAESSSPVVESLLPQPIERTPVPFDRIEVPLARDPLLALFTSLLMERGKRARAEKSVSETLLHIHALTKAPPLPVFRQAVERAAPAVRIVRHKTSAKVVMKPFALNERQRMRKAINWILEESDNRVGYTRAERIARECIDILLGSSKVLGSKGELHKLAMINRGNLPRVF